MRSSLPPIFAGKRKGLFRISAAGVILFSLLVEPASISRLCSRVWLTLPEAVGYSDGLYRMRPDYWEESCFYSAFGRLIPLPQRAFIKMTRFASSGHWKFICRPDARYLNSGVNMDLGMIIIIV